MGGRKSCGLGGPFSSEIRGTRSGDDSLIPGLKVGCFHPRRDVRSNLVVGHRPCGCSAVEGFLRPPGGLPTVGSDGGCARVSRKAVGGVLLRRGLFVGSIAVLGMWSCLFGLRYGTLFLWTDLLPAWRARGLSALIRRSSTLLLACILATTGVAGRRLRRGPLADRTRRWSTVDLLWSGMMANGIQPNRLVGTGLPAGLLQPRRLGRRFRLAYGSLRGCEFLRRVDL